MPEFFEIDLLDVETKCSGDAIAIRYEQNGVTNIHVVDGGFDDMADKIIDHIATHYGNKPIDHIVVTHPDRDHACGLRGIVERCNVGALWMLRPWLYADYLIHRFETYSSSARLASRLRSVYPYVADLEEIAKRRGIPIYEPFQGAQIGAFTVLAPTPQRYFDLVVRSEKTPEASEEQLVEASIFDDIFGAGAKLLNLVKGAWGYEVFSTEETSAENEMSVVQAAIIAGKRIVLTGDAGRSALAEAADYAPAAGLVLPGVDRFQVPHHGSRRNVSTELLDRWLGPRWDHMPAAGEETFHALCCAAKADKNHPRKVVERAFMHRGGMFVTTEDGNKCSFENAPARAGWSAIERRPYPQDYED